MGIIPLFDWGEANALFLWKNLLKSIKPDRGLNYLNLLKIVLSTLLWLILISYGCVFKRSSKPVMKGSRVESIEEARKEHKKILEEAGKKLIDSTFFIKKKW